MQIIKQKKVPEGFQMVSFDVKSLFTNVPLETMIDIILRKIYTNHELKTSLTKKKVKELLGSVPRMLISRLMDKFTSK